MSLLTYKEARPWARALKNAVVARTMPPWFADPNTSSHIRNERRLSQSDVDTIAKWADDGAREGDVKDAPPPMRFPEGGWQIKPDLIVEGPDYDVPAKGVVEWTWFIVPGGFAKDTWVTSIEVLPTQLAVTHHVCLSYIQRTAPTSRTTFLFFRGSSSAMPTAMKSAPLAASVAARSKPRMPLSGVAPAGARHREAPRFRASSA